MNEQIKEMLDVAREWEELSNSTVQPLSPEITIMYTIGSKLMSAIGLLAAQMEVKP